MDLTQYYLQRNNKEAWASKQLKWILEEMGDDLYGGFRINGGMGKAWYKAAGDILGGMLYSSGFFEQIRYYSLPEGKTRIVIKINRMSEDQRQEILKGWELSDDEEEEDDKIDDAAAVVAGRTQQ